MPITTRHNENPKVEFLGTKINIVNYCDICELITNAILYGNSEYICLTDVGNIVSASVDAQLKSAINGSFLSLADGTPLAYYARLAGFNRIERISGVQLMHMLFTENNGMSHYLLGDTDLTINNFIRKAREIYKGIKINGYSPPFREFTDQDNYNMAEKINKANPDIIWVCFGGGKQEKWMNHNIGSIENGILIGVGSALRWFLGEIKIPPLILQRLCLQWFYRLLSELVNDPQKGKEFFIQRQLRKFPIFLMNFPGELVKTRRLFKKLNFEERTHLSQECRKCTECRHRVNRPTILGPD